MNDRLDHCCSYCGATSEHLSILAWCSYETRAFETAKSDDDRVVYCNKCEQVARAVELPHADL